MELIKELGRRIQKARKEKGLTQRGTRRSEPRFSKARSRSCERGVKNPSFEVLRAFCKVLNLSLDSLMNLDLPEDEQAANDMRQLYLSCPPAARKVLLNSTRALTDELKEMVQTAGVDPDEHLENK
ncbi:MAG: helix-turn-helix domain-containing protein [Coprococcus phoceensis]